MVTPGTGVFVGLSLQADTFSGHSRSSPLLSLAGPVILMAPVLPVPSAVQLEMMAFGPHRTVWTLRDMALPGKSLRQP